ncbi:MAG: MFS transporter [Gammaproteobacteria bacterium]
MNRSVYLLAACQALMMTNASLMITASALIGFSLADNKALATLPLAFQFLATMFTAIPASLLMGRLGRKPGFIIAGVLGMVGGGLATWAIMDRSFWLFACATIFIGIFQGFGNYYRFTAAEIVPESHKSRAISYVLAGGVIAAFLGPNMANWTRYLEPSTEFAGSFLVVMAIYGLGMLIISAAQLPGPVQRHESGHGRPLAEIARQPVFMVAVICAMLGYGIMTLVMTATPLAMKGTGHSFPDTAFVIQWHVLGMFAPSFFTGSLIDRFGCLRIMLAGVLLDLLCIGLNLHGEGVWHYWGALLSLGLGWNFLFIGATTLVTETYTPEEKPRAQALNDFIVFTTVAVASLSAGALQYSLGWQAVNLGVIPLLLVVLASLYVLWRVQGWHHARPATR